MTSVPRTLFDLAAVSSVENVEYALREAEYRRLYDRLSLADLLDALPGPARRAGDPDLPCAARGSGRAEREARSRKLPAVPAPPRPAAAAAQRLARAWAGAGSRSTASGPPQRVVVELDGFAGHGTRTAFREDRARDRRLRVAGYEVVRIAWAQLDGRTRGDRRRSAHAPRRRAGGRLEHTNVCDNLQRPMTPSDNHRGASPPRRAGQPPRAHRRAPDPRPARGDGPLAARPRRARRRQRPDALPGRAGRDQPDPGRRHEDRRRPRADPLPAAAARRGPARRRQPLRLRRRTDARRPQLRGADPAAARPARRRLPARARARRQHRRPHRPADARARQPRDRGRPRRHPGADRRRQPLRARARATASPSTPTSRTISRTMARSRRGSSP